MLIIDKVVCVLAAACCSSLGAPALASESAPAPSASSAPAQAHAAPKQSAQALSPQDAQYAEHLAKLTTYELAMQNGDLPAAAELAKDMAEKNHDLVMARRAWVLYMLLNDRDEALNMAILWHDLDPADPEAQMQYMLTQASMGHYDPLVAALKKELREERHSFEQRLETTVGFISKISDPALALDIYQQLMQTLPQPSAQQQAALSYYEAVFAARAGEAALALDAAQRALGSPRFKSQALSLMLQLDDGPSRFKIWSQASKHLKRHPKDDRLRADYAQALAAGERWDLSLEELQTLIDAHPDQARLRYMKASILYQAGRYGKALKALEDYKAAGRRSLAQRRAEQAQPPRPLDSMAPPKVSAESSAAPLSDSPGNPADGVEPGRAGPLGLQELSQLYADSYFWLKGTILSAMKKPHQAIEAFRSITGEQQAEAQLVIAEIYFNQLNQDEQAFEALSEVPLDSSKYPEALRLQAMIYNARGDWSQAANMLEQANRLVRNDLDLALALAQTWIHNDRLQDALHLLEENVQLHPDNPESYNSYGYTLADQNQQLDKAQLLLERALAMEPESPYIWDSYGWLQFRLGNLELARAYLEMAWEKLPVADAAAHLAQLYWRLHEPDKAKQFLKEARKLDAQSPAAAQAAQILGEAG